MYNNFASTAVRDMFGHWILLGDWEAENFVNWLLKESGLHPYEVIAELEYQMTQPDADPLLIEECSEALKAIPVRCESCGRIIPYGFANVINRYKTDSHSEVISRSLFGGSTVRRKTSITYIAGRDFICDNCMESRKKNIKRKEKGSGIKKLFRKIAGVFTHHD